MSLLPTTLIPANYVSAGVINSFKQGTSDFETDQDGQGIKITNQTTGGFLEMGAGGFIVSPDGTTLFPVSLQNLSAVADNPTPQELVLVDTLVVQNDDTLPTEDIQVQAGINGGVGTFYGIQYNSATDQDFVIQTTNDNTGGVLFNQFGLGSTTTQTKINQGVIVSRNTANSNVITINPTTPSITITDGTNTNTITATGAGVSNTLQEVLTAGNTATGTSARIILNDTTTGGAGTPILNLTNSNATAGSTNGVPVMLVNKTGRAGATNDIIGQVSFNARNYASTLTEWVRFEASIRNTASGNDDGALGLYFLTNGVLAEVFRFNGADNENNTYRPIDMNGQDLKSSSGNLTLNTSSSSGTGQIILIPKTNAGVNIQSSATQFIKVNPFDSLYNNSITLTATDSSSFINSISINNNNSTPLIQLKRDFGSGIQKSITTACSTTGGGQNTLTAIDSQANLPFQIDTSGYVNGSIDLKVNDTSGDLLFTGTNIQSGTSGGNSGQHLRIKLNGTYYKIALQDD
jgi:hypothetical protein